jgi:hypothetical protein
MGQRRAAPVRDRWIFHNSNGSAAAGISVLVLVLVIAVVALGAAFGRSVARRERACRLLSRCSG